MLEAQISPLLLKLTCFLLHPQDRCRFRRSCTSQAIRQPSQPWPQPTPCWPTTARGSPSRSRHTLLKWNPDEYKAILIFKVPGLSQKINLTYFELCYSRQNRDCWDILKGWEISDTCMAQMVIALSWGLFVEIYKHFWFDYLKLRSIVTVKYQ